MDYILWYYGGEALFWPLGPYPGCASFLASIGRPVVVEVAVPGREIAAQAPARTALSHFARDANPSFSIDPGGFSLRRSVRPQDVLAVHDASAIRSAHRPPL